MHSVQKAVISAHEDCGHLLCVSKSPCSGARSQQQSVDNLSQRLCRWQPERHGREPPDCSSGARLPRDKSPTRTSRYRIPAAQPSRDATERSPVAASCLNLRRRTLSAPDCLTDIERSRRCRVSPRRSRVLDAFQMSAHPATVLRLFRFTPIPELAMTSELSLYLHVRPWRHRDHGSVRSTAVFTNNTTVRRDGPVLVRRSPGLRFGQLSQPK